VVVPFPRVEVHWWRHVGQIPPISNVIPQVAAVAKPMVFLARRLSPERATDSRTGGSEKFSFG
jgi:hypothetical protein